MTGASGARARGVIVRRAVNADRIGVERLLEAAGLPLAGVEQAWSGFVVAEVDGELVGAAGLEAHDGDGVLRSVAVAQSWRGRGLGRQLTARVLEDARRAGLERLYLLTTTAQDYFPSHGFRRIERREAPPGVRQSVEFREACPASAVAMVRDLEGAG